MKDLAAHPSVEDERGCGDIWFECDSGDAVLKSNVCDGAEQCDDGTDEAGCQFTCNDGEVLLGGDRCDGFEQCTEGEDELGCVQRACDEG